MNGELKACPICGGEALLEDYRDGGGVGFAVHCQNFTCQTCGPTDLHEAHAINAWNERLIENGLRRRIAELESEHDLLRSAVGQHNREKDAYNEEYGNLQAENAMFREALKWIVETTHMGYSSGGHSQSVYYAKNALGWVNDIQKS
jgi:hypothetical protein